MTKKLDLNIKETVPELKKLLHQQKSGRKKERILVLYLLKTQQAEDAFTTATVIGRNYSTVKRWLSCFWTIALLSTQQIIMTIHRYILQLFEDLMM